MPSLEPYLYCNVRMSPLHHAWLIVLGFECHPLNNSEIFLQLRLSERPLSFELKLQVRFACRFLPCALRALCACVSTIDALFPF